MDNDMQENRSLKLTFIISSIIVVIVCIILLSIHIVQSLSINDIDYIKKYTGLDLSNSYSSTEQYSKDNHTITKYVLKDNNVRYINNYIDNNWTKQSEDKLIESIQKLDKSDMINHLKKDIEFANYYIFNNKSDTMNIWVVNHYPIHSSSYSEYYIIVDYMKGE